MIAQAFSKKHLVLGGYSNGSTLSDNLAAQKHTLPYRQNFWTSTNNLIDNPFLRPSILLEGEGRKLPRVPTDCHYLAPVAAPCVGGYFQPTADCQNLAAYT